MPAFPTPTPPAPLPTAAPAGAPLPRSTAQVARLVARVKAILAAPRTEWPVIADEPDVRAHDLCRLCRAACRDRRDCALRRAGADRHAVAAHRRGARRHRRPASSARPSDVRAVSGQRVACSRNSSMRWRRSSAGSATRCGRSSSAPTATRRCGSPACCTSFPRWASSRCRQSVRALPAVSRPAGAHALPAASRPGLTGPVAAACALVLFFVFGGLTTCVAGFGPVDFL